MWCLDWMKTSQRPHRADKALQQDPNAPLRASICRWIPVYNENSFTSLMYSSAFSSVSIYIRQRGKITQDMVWYGMVCMVWYMYGMVWYGMYGMVYVWYGICMVWYGMVWYGMVRYGMYGMVYVWYGMVWTMYVWYIELESGCSAASRVRDTGVPPSNITSRRVIQTCTWIDRYAPGVAVLRT